MLRRCVGLKRSALQSTAAGPVEVIPAIAPPYEPLDDRLDPACGAHPFGVELVEGHLKRNAGIGHSRIPDHHPQGQSYRDASPFSNLAAGQVDSKGD
jgi:hypothetical protein